MSPVDLGDSSPQIRALGLELGQHRQNKKPWPDWGDGLGLHLRDGAADAKLILVTANTTIAGRKGCITYYKLIRPRGDLTLSMLTDKAGGR
jgi:hypothetical protein